MKTINCFIPYEEVAQVEQTIKNLKKSNLVTKIYLLSTSNLPSVDGCEVIVTKGLKSTDAIRKIAEKTDADYTLIYTKTTTLQWVNYSVERMVAIADDANAAMAYADHFKEANGVREEAPVIDYQFGSLRDDFDFGSVLLYRTSVLKDAVKRMDVEYDFAAQYDLRLKVSQKGDLVHINEYLYYEVENDTRKTGEKLFDYVDPKNRAVQIEMEQACTQHLKDIGGYLEPNFKHIEFTEDNFEFEASVIIPCKNRVKTIGDAIQSALNQKTNVPYNVIVVDDNSEDGTVDVIKKYLNDPKLVYIAQDKSYHAIGGNWNAAFHHPKCGKFALQLDSDDLYADENTVQKFVDAFYEQNCAMVVGTYKLTNFDLEMIPPGVIDHKEWTPDNGRNNALRINGLGAPRGFYVPMLRQINFPTTKYGEDYAVGLRVSREYQIGRIYDVIYNCRRWDDNSDASLDIVKMNGHNLYKDRIRTWELQARVAMNKK
ncbi:Glycosyltransferase group 2 family protein [uncultured Paludibacter sp.]|nr:Glycosyltransferase group 2 family protein [uncultured Paludibacter sp.]